MTREEAIKLLEYSATELVGTMMQTDEQTAVNQLQRYVDAYDMAISALREQEERSKGCEWCCDEIMFDGEDMELELQHPLEEESRMVYPRFCPMCGRRLEEV